MKKVILIAAMLLGVSYASFAQVDLDAEMFNGSNLLTTEGTVYVYEVDFYGNTYDFIVHVKSLDDGIEFDYEMTNTNNTKGIVKISKGAFENAIAQNNYFSGGEMNLDDQTTVWLSKKVFEDLVNTGKATISTDGGNTKIVIGDATAGHDFELYNAISEEPIEDLSYVYAESPDGSAKYWIHMSKYNPLILKMDIGWSITLKEMRSAE